MTDARIANLARIMVGYSLKLNKGERVAISGTTLAAPLLLALQREALLAGAHPHLLAELPQSEHILLTEGTIPQIAYVSPFQRIVVEEFDAMIRIASAANTRSLSGIEPRRQHARSQALAPLTKTRFQRGSTGSFRWVLSMFPTNAYAQDAEMSLQEFEDYVYHATFADSDDPIRSWQKVHDEQQRYVDWLKGKSDVRVKGRDVDLSLSIAGRTFRNSDGDRNMPSGEIFTGPVEQSVNGWIRFQYPAIFAGHAVEDVRLEFERGKVVSATAKKNEAFLQRMIASDPGASYLGEFAMGTNRNINRFIGNILFDEKIGGTIHVALGRGYPETGSRNESAIHWDMICDMRADGEITVDDELIYQSGNFLI